MKDRIVTEFITKLAEKIQNPNTNLIICLDDGYNVIEERGTHPRNVIADRDTLWELINFAFDGEFGDHNEVIDQLEAENEELRHKLTLAEIKIESIKAARKFHERLVDRILSKPPVN